MRRLASITPDDGLRAVWLARNVLALRTMDDRFHVFDLLVNLLVTPRVGQGRAFWSVGVGNGWTFGWGRAGSRVISWIGWINGVRVFSRAQPFGALQPGCIGEIAQ
jgi:hypothetical protein